MASPKTAFIAEQSVRQFFLQHRVVYYWTFTIADCCTKKSEAERRFKPFKDLIRRRGKEMLEFWELQKRGAWHVHLVTDAYLDVNWLRPWMMERGWGPQMKVKRVQSKGVWVQDRGWVPDEREVAGLVRYLVKYLLKCIRESDEAPAAFGHKKVFGGASKTWWAAGFLAAPFIGPVKERRGRRGVFAGNTSFSWNPFVDGRPGAMLYSYGKTFFRELYGSLPSWRDVTHCIRLGYEYCNYEAFDPFYVPP